MVTGTVLCESQLSLGSGPGRGQAADFRFNSLQPDGFRRSLEGHSTIHADLGPIMVPHLGRSATPALKYKYQEQGR